MGQHCKSISKSHLCNTTPLEGKSHVRVRFIHINYLLSSRAWAACGLCQPIIWSMAAMLCDSVAIVVRMRPRAIPLDMITMRKSTHGFPCLSDMSMGLRLAAPRAAEGPLLSEF